jgi:hypothetical protein
MLRMLGLSLRWGLDNIKNKSTEKFVFKFHRAQNTSSAS